MLTAQQYRTKAAEYADLAKTAHSPSAAREFRSLARIWSSLAANKEWLADPDGRSVTTSQKVDHARGDEEQILKCLGTAVIMRWSTLPKNVQRELFEYAGSIGDLQKTTAGQVARFLHDHLDDAQKPVAHLA
jgi:hypothetical protein